MRAAIYTRISRDSTGDGAGVARQEDDCRQLATSKGFDLAAVFTDNDVSAYSRTPRPGYLRMLAAIRSREVDAVLVWHTDRLYRRMQDLEEYIAICQDRGVPTFSVQAGPLDLTTPAGRMVARTLGSVAQYESEQKAERQMRANLQRALQGKHFGTRRCFGFEMDGVTVREVEAQAIRDACQALLDGASLGSIAKRWNGQGLRTPQAGNEWDSSVLALTLRTSRLAGLRSYRRQVLLDLQGDPVKGQWPAIVDIDTWRAVQTVLRDPSRKWPGHARGLLSGVATCAVCGLVMQSGGTRNGRRRYRCSGGGSHPYREAEPIDRFVTDVVLAYLSRPDIAAQIAPSPETHQAVEVRGQLAEVGQRSDRLVSAFSDGLITFQQLTEGQERLARHREELERRLPVPRAPTLAKLASAADPAALWSRLETDEQRAVIDALLYVRVKPTRTKEATYLDWRARVLNPSSLELQWKAPGDDANLEGVRRKRTVR